MMPIYFTLVLSFFIVMGMQTGRVIITLYALKLGAQPFTVGALAALVSLLPTVLSWHVGRLADRFGSRWLLMLCTASGALGMLISYAIPGFPSLFIASVLYGLLFALAISPLQNLVGLLSKPENRTKNFSNFTLVASFTGSAGPLLAGFTIDNAGPDIACLALAILFVAPAAMIVIWGGSLPRGTETAKSTGNLRILFSESGLWQILATGSLVIAGVDLFQVYIPVYGHKIGLSASAIGIILASNASANFVVRFFLTPLISRLTMEKLLACSFLIGAVGFLLIPLSNNIIMLSLISFLFGLGMGCGQPITLMMTFSNSIRGRSGEVMGLRVTVNYLTRMMSQFIFGLVSSVFGLFPVFLKGEWNVPRIKEQQI